MRRQDDSCLPAGSALGVQIGVGKSRGLTDLAGAVELVLRRRTIGAEGRAGDREIAGEMTQDANARIEDVLADSRLRFHGRRVFVGVEGAKEINAAACTERPLRGRPEHFSVDTGLALPCRNVLCTAGQAFREADFVIDSPHIPGIRAAKGQQVRTDGLRPADSAAKLGRRCFDKAGQRFRFSTGGD